MQYFKEELINHLGGGALVEEQILVFHSDFLKCKFIYQVYFMTILSIHAKLFH